MPAVLSKIYDIRRSPFIQFAALHTSEHVKVETGFSADTLEYLWDKYSHCLPKRQRNQEARMMYFYFVFKYIHFYPTWEQAPSVLWTPDMVRVKGAGISAKTLEQQVITYLALLAVTTCHNQRGRLEPTAAAVQSH